MYVVHIEVTFSFSSAHYILRVVHVHALNSILLFSRSDFTAKSCIRIMINANFNISHTCSYVIVA